MVEPQITLDITWVLVVALISFAGVLATKITLKGDSYQLKLYRDRHKESEKYIKELEDDCRSLQMKLNRREVGPKIEGNPEELTDLIPQIIPQFSSFAPKWMQPILNNRDIQHWLGEYVQKHPEKAGELFARFIRKKGEPTPNAGSAGYQTEVL